MAELDFNAFDVTEPDGERGAWALLNEITKRSDPVRDGGPEFNVPEQVRQALVTADIDRGDWVQEATAVAEVNEKLIGLLKRARRVLPDVHGMVSLRCAIDEAIR